ncbi:enoyl-CoA hydratase/isomerase family protein, partial [Patescibacteria group bacterium]|nr:enoyl-CoA hydratase/isomerase family protein [Patescibacteria group bacterium]
LVGADVVCDCIASLERQEPDGGWIVPKFLDEMVEKNTLGEKSGKGFYSYGATVNVEEFGDVARVTFGDGKGNILSLKLVQKLTEQFRLLKNKNYRAIFLTGRGKNFSVGANIKEFPLCLRSRQDAHYAITAFADLMSAIAECKSSVIALVRGRCWGGGYELALACDLIFAEKGSEVRLPEVGLGILPGAGGTQRLLRRVGFRKGAPVVLDAKARKVKKPFIDGVVPSDEFLGNSHQSEFFLSKLLFASVQLPKRLFPALKYSWKDRIAYAGFSAKIALYRMFGWAPVSAQLALDAMWRSNQLPLEEGLDLERDAIAGDADEEEGKAGAFQTDDAEEGIRAFLEKRKPKFGWRKYH